MNANRLISMVIRMVMRRVIGRGLNAGIGAMSKRGKTSETKSPESGKTKKRMRQTGRIARRMGRF